MARYSTLCGVATLLCLAGCGPSPLKQIPPGLPSAPTSVTRDAANGGRVQSIAVDPRNRNHAVIAMQFGGLWRTFNAGETWFRTYSLPAVYVTDVEFGSRQSARLRIAFPTLRMCLVFGMSARISASLSVLTTGLHGRIIASM